MSNFIVLATTFIIVTPNLVRSNEGDGLDVTFATNGDSETQIVCVVNDGGMRGFRGVKDVEWQVFPCVEENMDYCQSVAMSPGNKLRCHTVCCASFKARTTTSTKAHLHVMITTTSLPRRTSTSWIDLSTAQKPKMMAASHNASTSKFEYQISFFSQARYSEFFSCCCIKLKLIKFINFIE